MPSITPSPSSNTAALKAIKKAVEDNTDKLDEVNLTAQRTHLGHETHLWDAEVKPEDVEG